VNCVEDLVAILDQAHAARHECVNNMDRDGGREKQRHHANNEFRPNVDDVQMICMPQEPFRDSEETEVERSELI
jgi:hypothetical protein